MALKDWKIKQKNSKDFFILWTNKYREDDFIEISFKKTKGYEVYYGTDGEPGVDDSVKYFKTKSEALSFAKSYMRTH